MTEGDLQKRVGRNLRAYRLERGLSQEAFAEQLGVHRTYLGGLERGGPNHSLETMEQSTGVPVPKSDKSFESFEYN